MLRIIINADDFGKNHVVNIAIEEQIKRGYITSTTIMANADGFDEAILIAKQHPNISYGVHLSLDEYAPMTTPKVFVDRGIVDADTGLFVKGRIWNIFIDNELKDAVRAEWNAQIKKIKDAGVTPSHIDSHHHVHTIPALKEVLLEVLKKNSITRVRGCDYVTFSKLLRGWKHFSSSNKVKELAYYLLRFSRSRSNASWMRDVRKSFRTTDDLCSVTSFKENIAYFEKFGMNMSIELECHPGHERYAKETALLEQIKNVYKISYIDL